MLFRSPISSLKLLLDDIAISDKASASGYSFNPESANINTPSSFNNSYDFSNTLSMWKNILTQEDERLSVELETLESICNSYINQKKELELMQMLTGYAINQSAYQNDSEFIEYLQNGVLNGN